MNYSVKVSLIVSKHDRKPRVPPKNHSSVDRVTQQTIHKDEDDFSALEMCNTTITLQD